MKSTSNEVGSKPSEENRGPQVSAAASVPLAGSKRAARPKNGDAASAERSPYAESLLETFAATPRLKAFSSAIGTAGLSELLRGDGPLTIFAPTDRAFDRMPDGERAALLGDTVRLGEFIRHHVVTGRVKAPRETKPRSVTPQFGADLSLTRTPKGFRVAEARIVKTNIRASNGVIHAIDRVLDPG
jgi:uncharacterized surface protein with fasciclin (FAS1) repeats